MATLIIRQLDDEVKEKLRVRAARHGRSMEAEVREILATALNRPIPEYGLGTWIHDQFAAIGGVDLEIPEREPWKPAVEFPE